MIGEEGVHEGKNILHAQAHSTPATKSPKHATLVPGKFRVFPVLPDPPFGHPFFGFWKGRRISMDGIWLSAHLCLMCVDPSLSLAHQQITNFMSDDYLLLWVSHIPLL